MSFGEYIIVHQTHSKKERRKERKGNKKRKRKEWRQRKEKEEGREERRNKERRRPVNPHLFSRGNESIFPETQDISESGSNAVNSRMFYQLLRPSFFQEDLPSSCHVPSSMATPIGLALWGRSHVDSLPHRRPSWRRLLHSR